MPSKIIFSKNDLIDSTGINYIYENYQAIFNKSTYELSSSIFPQALDYTPSRFNLVIFSILLFALLAPLKLVQVIAKYSSDRESIFIVGHLHNLRSIYLFTFLELGGVYCVDSLFNYHKLRFEGKPKFIRFFLLIPSYLIELSICILLFNKTLFFNSNFVAESFYKRYRFIINRKDNIRCLNIGAPISPKKTNSFQHFPSSKIITLAVYGNFEFYETLTGLNYFLKSLKHFSKGYKNRFLIKIFGKSSLKFFKEYDKQIINNVEISVLGKVDSIEESLTDVHFILIPVIKTGGLKIKLLEGLAYGIPVITTKEVTKHLMVPTEKLNIVEFENLNSLCRNLDSINEFNKVFNRENIILPSWEMHYQQISLLLNKSNA